MTCSAYRILPAGHQDPDPTVLAVSGVCGLGHPLRFRLQGPDRVLASCPSCTALKEVQEELAVLEVDPERREALRGILGRLQAGVDIRALRAAGTAGRAERDRPRVDPPGAVRDVVIRSVRVPSDGSGPGVLAPCGHGHVLLGVPSGGPGGRGTWAPIRWGCPRCRGAWIIQPQVARMVRGSVLLSVACRPDP